MSFTDLPSQMLLVDGIYPDQLQPRRSFDLTQHETLKASIALYGVLQPILVRWEEARQHHVIVVGERRWRCAKELELKEIPARVVEGEVMPELLTSVQLVENLMRENLNPIDEARSLARLQDLLGCSRDELAKRTQRSPASICRSFKLLELPADVQSLVETGQLPASIAAELHRCSCPAMQRELALKVAASELNREDVIQSLRDAVIIRPVSKPKSQSLNLGSGISLRISAGTSLKACEAAVSVLLRKLRDAKASSMDLAAFAASLSDETANAVR